MYKDLNLKIGIELHQQLSGKQLFCECSSSLEEENFISQIRRKIRVVFGELGEMDIAGAYEMLRDKEFIYNCYKNETCLVDCDEEPCHIINQDHLKNTLKLAKFLRLQIPSYLCIMRKNVFDGSVSPAFQRTTIVGLESKDSFIETSQGKVKLEQLNLEEDASKIISKENNKIIYSLSRQGIALWELGTDATIKSPSHAVEVAKHLGMIFRSFDCIKRGIGTIRQDVNISIKNGARVEIKGWQDLKTLKLLIENEIQRQVSLIALKNKKIIIEKKEVTNVFKNCKFKIIQKLLEENAIILALKIENFNFKQEICRSKTLGKEIAEYATAYGVNGLIHSDEELKKYNLEVEFQELRELFKAKNNDLILIICEKEKVCKKAMDAVIERLNLIKNGVLEETRIPNYSNATSSYARPLPGSSRMYPETDHPLIKVENLDKLERVILLTEKINLIMKKYNISESLAKEILEEDIEHYLDKNARFRAHCLIEIPKEIKTRFNLDGLKPENIYEVIKRVENNEISKEVIIEVLIDFLKNKRFNFEKFKKKNIDEQEIIKIIQENKNASFNAIMGIVMKKFKGIDTRKLIETIKKNI